MSNGSKLEEEVWNEFNGNWEKLAFESEKLIAEFSHKKTEETTQIEMGDIPFKDGMEREVLIKQRVNQSFFRSTVLSSYYSKCCIT